MCYSDVRYSDAKKNRVSVQIELPVVRAESHMIANKIGVMLNEA